MDFKTPYVDINQKLFYKKTSNKYISKHHMLILIPIFNNGLLEAVYYFKTPYVDINLSFLQNGHLTG